MTFRQRLYHALEPTVKGNWVEKVVEFILIFLITTNILAIILDSVKSIHDNYDHMIKRFEFISALIFTAEYICRVYAIVENAKYHHPVKGRIKFITSPLAVVDLLAFLPYYLTFFTFDLRFLRIIRLMGLFRMFKIARYLQALNVFRKVLYERREQLILSIIFILFVLVIISSIMFYVEHPTQPQAFSSIPATMWWGVSTLTTVGYGDIVPMTSLGKFLGGMFAIVGIGLFALPAGILSSGFYELMHRTRRRRRCPHCGEELED